MHTHPAQTATAAPERPLGRWVPVQFTGRADEYFRIWIVNVALTIVTLGIYGAWAKVRTRRYLYGHTWLDGHNFEYTARPTAILIGHLIVGGAFLAYTLTDTFGADEALGFSPIALAIVVAFFAVFPFLVYQSLRFQARNTVYRGLRFGFHGTLGQAYVKFLAWLLLVPATLGLIYPYVVYLQRQYLAANTRYGTARTTFHGEAGNVYVTYAIALGLLIGTYTIFGILLAVTLVPLFLSAWDTEISDLFTITGLVIGAFAYVLFMLGMTGIAQFVKASLMNFTLNYTELDGRIRFRSRVNPWTLAWIQITNLLAQVFTLGLATPWATVRRASYILSAIELDVTGDLDVFTAEHAPPVGAIGEAASDFFDFELGF